MAKNLMGAILLAGLLSSCHRNLPATLPDRNNKATKYASCYRYVSGGDSIRMQLFIADSGIKGTLVYDHPGRQSEGGFFSGHAKGDTLYADFTYKSGNAAGVREVAFLRKKEGLLEGTGATENRNGKTVFTNPSAVTFPEERLLQQTACSGSNSQ